MEKLTEVLTMGGYGSFVWASFGFAFVVLCFLVISTMRGLRKAKHDLANVQP